MVARAGTIELDSATAVIVDDLKRVPIVIICRDRLAPLRELLDWLKAAEYDRVILVDNASTYAPLVDFLANTTAEVVRLGKNLGPRAPWCAEVRSRLHPDRPFVVTDCDVVPDERCPRDVIGHFAGLLLRYADLDKVGLGLRLDDLPDSYALKAEVIEWESQFWESEIAPGVFRAPVDTTFALYRSPADGYTLERALRTGPPYLGRHLPWYANSSYASEEEQYYLEHADRSVTHWVGGLVDGDLQHLLARRADAIATRELVKQSGNPLLNPWVVEPLTEDESKFTPWATPGWEAWNDMSPEVEFCDFVGSIVRLTQPDLTVETGIGQGFMTRRLARWLGPGQQLISFEDDPEIRAALTALPFFRAPDRCLGATPSPTQADLARADLTVLDSAFPARLDEFDSWLAAARPGAVLVVHDAAERHGPDTPHYVMRRSIEESGLRGIFLQNPRGGFVAIKSAEPALRQELADERGRRRHAEGELVGIRSSRAYRLIGIRGRIRRSIRGDVR